MWTLIKDTWDTIDTARLHRSEGGFALSVHRCIRFDRGWVLGCLLFVLAPVAAAFTHAMLSQKREYAADRDAAAISNPHDLADALIRLDRSAELVDFTASPATEPLYTVDPFEPDKISRMFRTHPPLADRLQRLRGIETPGEQAA